MIALLAAVPAETRLIRRALEKREQRRANGLDLTFGTLHGVEVCLAHGGIGKAAAAAAAIGLVVACRTDALWLFGCGGAYPGSGLNVGDLALADGEIFGDEGVRSPEGFLDLERLGYPMRHDQGEERYNHWPVDETLHQWARPLLAEHAAERGKSFRSGPFVTVSTCTGTTITAQKIARHTGGICENMEGAAVALACRQAGVPMLEVRGISNRVEDRNSSGWDLPGGMAAAEEALLVLLAARGAA